MGEVDYAVTTPFDEINGRTKIYVQVSGSIDGAIDFAHGDTLVFFKQENYPNYTGSDDGWFRSIISGGAATIETIPGYLENLANPTIQNHRAGIWRINMLGDTVTLDFVQEVEINQLLTVKKGVSLQNSSIYYNPVISEGNSVPEYTVVTGPDHGLKTIFDGNGTRFFSYRDNYSRPTENAKYIRFPQFGAIK